MHHLRGEFAVIIWDDSKKRMLVARDRFGVKPIYYTTVNDVFMAASEIKAFSALGWRPEWVRREKMPLHPLGETSPLSIIFLPFIFL